MDSGVVLADFSASWCAPCNALKPQFAKASADERVVERGVKFVVVDVDKNPALSAKYKITSLPTILYLEDGKFDPYSTKHNIVDHPLIAEKIVEMAIQ